MLNNEPDPKKDLKKVRGVFNSCENLMQIDSEIFKFENLTEAELNNETYLYYLGEIMKKSYRNSKENQIILRHLMKMNNFLNMIQESNIDINNMLSTISEYIRYQYVEKENLLFKIGDKGDKFYIILKGKIDILVSNETKEKLTEGDYVLYLSRLRKYEEYEILNRIIVANKAIFPIEFDNFDYFIKKCIEMIKEILNVTDFINYKYEEEDIERIFTSPQNKRFTTKSLIYAIFSDSIVSIYKDFLLLDNYNLISSYIEKVENISNMKPNSPVRKRINKILNSSDAMIGNAPKNDSSSLIKIVNKNDNMISHNPLISENTSPENKNKKELNVCNSKKYVERYKIKAYDANPRDKNESLLTFSIIQYNFILTLSNGSIFGEKALMPNCQKRTASIITSEDTHLGVLTKDIYTECICEVDEKIKKQNKALLLSNILFHDIDKNKFEKRYFNFFIFNRISRNQKIFCEGKTPDGIYFIREGEYDVSLKTSINELLNIIKTLILGGMNKEYSLRKYFTSSQLKQKQNLNSLKRHLHMLLYEKFSNFFTDVLPFGSIESDPCLSEYLSEKRLFKISSISKNDVIGFEDFICNDKNIFTVECTTQKGSYFSLDYQFLKSITFSEKITKEAYENILNSKKEYLIERLINIKKVYLDKYFKRKSFTLTQAIHVEAKNRKETLNNSSLNESKIEKENMNKSIIHKNKSLQKAACKQINPENKKENNAFDRQKSFIKTLQDLREKNDNSWLMHKSAILTKRGFKKTLGKNNNHGDDSNNKNYIDNQSAKSLNNKNKKEIQENNLFCFTERQKNIFEGFLNSNKLKTAYKQSNDKLDFLSTINQSSSALEKNLYFTNFPIFKVDYSNNFNNLNANSAINKKHENNHLYIRKEIENTSYGTTSSKDNGDQKPVFPKIWNIMNNSTLLSLKQQNVKSKLFAHCDENFHSDKNLINHPISKTSYKNHSFKDKETRNFRSGNFNDSSVSKFNETNNLRHFMNFSSSKINTNSDKLKFFNSNYTTKPTLKNDVMINLENRINSSYHKENKNRELLHMSLNTDVSKSDDNRDISASLCSYNFYELRMNCNKSQDDYYKLESDYKKKYSFDKISKKDREKSLHVKDTTSTITAKMGQTLFDSNNTKLRNLKNFHSHLFLQTKNNQYSQKFIKNYLSTKINSKETPKLSINQTGKLNLKISDESTNYSSNINRNSNNNTFRNNSCYNNEKIKTNKENFNADLNYKIKYNEEKQDKTDKGENYVDNQINIFNSTHKIFKKAKNTDFLSQEKKTVTKKILNYKYNISSNYLSKNLIFTNNEYDSSEFFDEIKLCRLLALKQIHFEDIHKLKLIPNFNLSYFNKLLKNIIHKRQNKFNNALLNKKINISEESISSEPEENSSLYNRQNIINQSISFNKQNYYLANQVENIDKIKHEQYNSNEIIIPDENFLNNKNNISNVNSLIKNESAIIESNKNPDINTDKVIEEKVNSENYTYNNNLASLSGANKNIINYKDRIGKCIVNKENILYSWGTKYSNKNQATKLFLNLNTNLRNSESLKTRLLPDCIIDQHKLSIKRKENLIFSKQKNTLARTQGIFHKFVIKKKKNIKCDNTQIEKTCQNTSLIKKF